MFIDTHVHFDRFVKDGTFDEILANAKEAQVHEMVAIGGSTEANTLSLQLAEEHPGQIFGCAGYDGDEAGKDLYFEGAIALLKDHAIRGGDGWCGVFKEAILFNRSVFSGWLGGSGVAAVFLRLSQTLKVRR